jgi:hypothetical protein
MHAITSAVLAQGKAAACFDRVYTELDDMCTDRGYERSVGLVMRIKEQGNLWSAPVCSTWGYLARSTTKRSRGNPSGQIAFNRTRNANRMVVLMSMLTLLAWTRNVHVWIEQPQNSCMQTFEPFKSVCEHVLTEQCLTYLWQFDQRGNCKPLRIFSSHP